MPEVDDRASYNVRAHLASPVPASCPAATGSRHGATRCSPAVPPIASTWRSCRSDRGAHQALEFHWRNSEQLQGDLVETVTALREQDGHIALGGSVSVVRQLLAAGLVDEDAKAHCHKTGERAAFEWVRGIIGGDREVDDPTPRTEG